MANVAVPVALSGVSVTTFGAPVANALNRMGCTATRATALTIPQNALTSVTFTAEVADTHGFLAVPTNTITIPANCEGLYGIAFAAVFSATINGYVRITTSLGTYWQSQGGQFGDISVSASPIPMVAGNTITINFWNSAAAANLATARLDVYRIGL